MKSPTVALLSAFALTLACTRESRPPAHAPTASSTLPTQTALVSTAEPGTAAQPGAATIPTNTPSIPTPVAPPAPTDQKSLVATSSPDGSRPNIADVAPSQAPLDPKLDKAETERDRESVREIRALLAADKSLSATARAVTVIAKDGKVRLTGQVNTAEERAAIERSARQAANVRDVKNDLVVLNP